MTGVLALVAGTWGFAARPGRARPAPFSVCKVRRACSLCTQPGSAGGSTTTLRRPGVCDCSLGKAGLQGRGAGGGGEEPCTWTRAQANRPPPEGSSSSHPVESRHGQVTCDMPVCVKCMSYPRGGVRVGGRRLGPAAHAASQPSAHCFLHLLTAHLFLCSLRTPGAPTHTQPLLPSPPLRPTCEPPASFPLVPTSVPERGPPPAHPVPSRARRGQLDGGLRALQPVRGAPPPGDRASGDSEGGGPSGQGWQPRRTPRCP